MHPFVLFLNKAPLVLLHAIRSPFGLVDIQLGRGGVEMVGEAWCGCCGDGAVVGCGRSDGRWWSIDVGGSLMGVVGVVVGVVVMLGGRWIRDVNGGGVDWRWCAPAVAAGSFAGDGRRLHKTWPEKGRRRNTYGEYKCGLLGLEMR
ncbi:hypothetical protein Tco_0898938 [Tanacetum coccineum]